MPSKSSDPGVSRRELLGGAGAVGLAGLMATGAAAPAAAQGATASGRAMDDIKVSRGGVYETVPLKQDNISVTAIQSRVKSVDVKNLKPTLKANLDHVLRLIDQAQGSDEMWGGERLWGGKQDLICLHEFPIQGFQPWNRAELNRIAFELPGPEVEAIGERAKRHDCYISFGCYAREKDWPDHVINMSVIVGPDGSIVSKQWKARNILGLFGEDALIGTTVYDVLDRYVEMYGWDATLPIARTPIGNIAVTAVGVEPMLYSCLAMKGAEIIVLSVTGGSNPDAAASCARANRVYCLGVGNSVTPDNIGFPEAAGARDQGTVICDPRGNFVARTTNHHEDFASGRIPIADFRKTRRVPELPMALMLPVLQQYQPVFQPNAFMGRLPQTYKEAGTLVRERMQRK
jgi:predicted amidohydrolase